MKKLKKLNSFLRKNNYKEELEILLKIARDSDETYTYLINKIIELFKNNSEDISSDTNIKKYRIDLRDLEFYDYTILDITSLGNFLDLVIYHPSEDNRDEKDQNFKAMLSKIQPGSTPAISFYLNEFEWDSLNSSGNILNSLLLKEIGLLTHEITHFLNTIRFINPKNNMAVSSYGRQNTGEGSFGYVNSTEEVQARIISVISFITNELIVKDQGKNLYDFYRQKWLPIYENNTGTKIEKFLAKLLYYVVNNDLNSFVNHIFRASNTLYIDNNLLIEKTKKRYMNRLYDLFITLKNKLENKQLEEYEDFPEYIEL